VTPRKATARELQRKLGAYIFTKRMRAMKYKLEIQLPPTQTTSEVFTTFVTHLSILCFNLKPPFKMYRVKNRSVDSVCTSEAYSQKMGLKD
jgi:hypothetical protein